MLFVLFIVVSRLLYTTGYSVTCQAGATECFVVSASAVEMEMRGSYAIISQDATPIVVKVTGPPPASIEYYTSKNKDAESETPQDGEFSFVAEKIGDYRLCISNGDEEHNDGSPRMVAFNFRAIGNGFKNYTYPGIDSELAELKQGFELFKDHQSYMNQRENVHKETLESINSKVLFWTCLEALILVLMAYLQIKYIANFLETKRKL